MAKTAESLSDSARLIELGLKLLETPPELYQQRRMLNQAIFHTLYVRDDQITDHDLRDPFGRFHAVQRARHATTQPGWTNSTTCTEPEDTIE